MQETPFKTAETARKLCGKLYFRIRKSITKFHIRVRKPNFKLWKAFFKKGLERNCKIKNVFDVEKDCDILCREKNCL